ncbi:MAG: ATP-binding protein [Proteobacteria bacterium]|nr:ATP-binding protein [Pseudomonadota bacterium]
MALISLFCCLVSAMLASAVIARDPGLRVNRLMGLVAAAVSWWALCEVVWNVQRDAEIVAWCIRFSSLGWMMLGPLAFHVFVEMSGDRSRLRRSIPVVYGFAALGVSIYVATPWGLAEAFPTSWGWGYHFGPLFPVAYLCTVVPASLVLINWWRVHPKQGSWGERRVSRVFFVGVSAALLVASTTDVMLPLLGHQVPRLATLSMTGLGLAVAWHLQRYGYSLLSPGAFTEDILETLGDGVAVLYSDGRVRTANRALEELVGAPRGGLRDAEVTSFLPELGTRELGSGTRWSEASLELETELHTRQGEKLPVCVSSSALARTHGAVYGAAVVVRDLAEVVSLRSRLVTSGRLAAVGELSAGIANEIVEPLRDVRHNLRDLRVEWGQLSEEAKAAEPGPLAGSDDIHAVLAEGEELIDECLEGVDRVAAIARDVAGFSETGRRERELRDLNPLVQNALRMAQPRIGAGVRIERDLGELPAVACAPQELEQVVLNLLHNAFHAVGDEGRVRISTRAGEGHVQLRIEDNGPGIPDEVRDRVFDPFFTTKPVGEGTGLGLAISYHIVRNHGGEIRIDSEPGAGCAFTVELPVAEPREDEVV